jgi:hypothetical protein
MEAQHRLAELVGLLEDAGVDVVVADPDGSPLERYSVVSVVSGAYGFREEVMWLELESRLLVGLVTPAVRSHQPLRAGTR